jgi:GTP-binding nuclear protein Ran
MAQPRRFKVLLLGDGGVGKTTFLNRLVTGEFIPHYIATMGVSVAPLPIQTTKGQIILNIWDTAGQEKFSQHRATYYNDADAAIVFFDTTSKLSYRNAANWCQEILAARPDILLVLCGNKVDVRGRVVMPQDIQLHRQLGCQYYDLSAKSNYNYDKPFLYIVRQLLNDKTIAYANA